MRRTGHRKQAGNGGAGRRPSRPIQGAGTYGGGAVVESDRPSRIAGRNGGSKAHRAVGLRWCKGTHCCKGGRGDLHDIENHLSVADRETGPISMDNGRAVELESPVSDNGAPVYLDERVSARAQSRG